MADKQRGITEDGFNNAHFTDLNEKYFKEETNNG